MSNEPERPSFQLRRAVPVAGPGIEDSTEHVESAPAASRHSSDQEVKTARQRAMGTQLTHTTDSRRPPSQRLEGRRQLSVDLETVMALLDVVKSSERKPLKSIIDILNGLTPNQRMRALKVINGIFQ